MTYGQHYAGTSRVDWTEPSDYCTDCGVGLSAMDIATHTRICQWCSRDRQDTRYGEYRHDQTDDDQGTIL